MIDVPGGIAIQTDGKIVFSGTSCIDGSTCDAALVRLNSNGTLDTSFGVNGKVTIDGLSGNSLALQGNKIVGVGSVHDGTSWNGVVYRYNSNGSLDTTFSGDGILPINFGQEDFFYAVAVYSGKIYVMGDSGPSDWSEGDFIVARINSNGTLDTAFSGDGKVRTSLGTVDSPYDLAISSGKVIVVGFSDNNIAIVRYTASGALDTTFSGDGKLKSNLGFPSPVLRGVAIQSGKIVVSGKTDGGSGDALLARFTSAGILDTTFSTDGIVTTDWGGGETYSSVMFNNARLYVVGTSKTTSNVRRFIIAAYKP